MVVADFNLVFLQFIAILRVTIKTLRSGPLMECVVSSIQHPRANLAAETSWGLVVVAVGISVGRIVGRPVIDVC